MGRDVFVAIGQKILEANSAEDIITLFGVLRGDHVISDMKTLMPNHSVIKKYLSENGSVRWQGAASWVDWWLRERHLRKQTF